MKHYGFVYILADHKMGALYIGSTSDLLLRILQHKNKEFPGHTSKYNIDKLVYVERYESLEYMVKRERQMKEWKRNWKLKLIIDKNPDWIDLTNQVLYEYGYQQNPDYGPIYVPTDDTIVTPAKAGV